MNQTLSLYRLQQIDIQIDRLQARLHTIQEILADDAELRQISEQANVIEARYKAAEQALKQAEGEVQGQHIKIEQTQSDLYGAKSHSPKELQDLQNDVASLKRHLAVLEDSQIEAMIASETAAADLESAQAKLLEVQVEQTEKNKGFNLEQATLKADLERFFVERNAVAGTIPPTDLALYDQLRQQRRGIAVAVIGDKSCGACGSTLSLAQIQSARSSGQMTLCPSCGRILYGS
jgi:predicted  nucleic acid-binding Zn-ribbon protein